HNSAKTSLLGVDAETLECHGAVSREVAEQMAAGARSRLDSTLGLATTGIAGPDGGTPEKPVGTVCIALASENRMFSHRYQLWGNREWIKLLTSQISLDWVRRVLLNEDPLQSAVLRK
ncbi:MAG: nicotinamide-nucleotide amidohydrolase family protein, partial [Candidatus Zixiibacteriota bacterium]